MINLRENLSVIITTHVLPSAPSTDVIESTIDSIRNSFTGITNCDTRIYCDSNVDNINYEAYVENLRKIKNVSVVDVPHKGFPYSGLQNNYINSIKNSTTPFVLCCEHDWFFLREIDTSLLIQTMLDNDFVNFVRFNKRDNIKAHIRNPEPGDADFWETFVQEEKLPLEQPLMKTDCIATHPHIIRTDKFVRDWVDIASSTKTRVPGMVEFNLINAYKRDIARMGFQKAHRSWGVYNYGGKYDKKIITHLDGSEKF
mgnify:FL=1